MGSLPASQLHVAFFPLMAYGHMIPIIDIARLLDSRSVKVTIITTPANAHVFTKSFDKTNNPSLDIHIEIFEFPSEEAGLPKGLENLEDTTSDLTYKFIQATELFEKPLVKFFEEKKPNCIVADIFLPWVSNVAARFRIPRLVFHGTSYFSMCVSESMKRYEPHKVVSSDDEHFVVPNLPDEISLTRMMLSPNLKATEESDLGRFFQEAIEAVKRSYGTIMNTFLELEPAYAEYHRNIMGQRSWHIGPVSLSNRYMAEKGQRGKQAAIDQHECLKWLDSKEPNSVIYICFGSMTTFTPPQLQEIAAALEASEQNFIWVIRRDRRIERNE